MAGMTIANPLTCSIEIRYEPMFSTVCRIGNAPFWGTLTIIYTPGDVLLEFEAFENWLKSCAMTPTTVEEFTEQVFEQLQTVLGRVSLTVAARALTTVHHPVTVTIQGTNHES